MEILTITLPTATTLAGFTVSNLYYESLFEPWHRRIPGNRLLQARRRRVAGVHGAQEEHAQYRRLLYVGITPALVSTIAFGYKPGIGLIDAVKNDFSVKSLDVVATTCRRPPNRLAAPVRRRVSQPWRFALARLAVGAPISGI